MNEGAQYPRAKAAITALLFALLLGLTALLVITVGSAAASVPPVGSDQAADVGPAHPTGTAHMGSRTPDPMQTPRMGSCTPWPMHTPMATRTPHMKGSRTPMATRTHMPVSIDQVADVGPAHPTGTAHMGSRTPDPMQTPRMGSCTPMPMRTAMMTRTPYMKGSRTPMATRTPYMGSRTPMATRTHMTASLDQVGGMEPAHPTGTVYMGSRTPWPTRTPYMGSRTPWPTRTPYMGSRTPWPTRTPYMGSRTPMPTRTHMPPPTGSVTPRPPIRHLLAIRPMVQFGYAQPGQQVVYHQILLNRFLQPTLVNLSAQSMMDWEVDVDPEEVTVQPNLSVTLDVTLSVPLSPTMPFDVTRVRAVSAPPVQAMASAHIVTILQRQPFVDLDPSHWADGPVQYLAGIGVLGGYEDGSFKPNNNVTRAQFAKMLSNAMGWQPLAPAVPSFSDVSPSHWAYGYIEAAAAQGVIGGYQDGTFRPQAELTRAQIAKMVTLARNWQAFPELPASFGDVNLGDWFTPYVAAVTQAGVMTGYEDGTFRPNAFATRAQVAKILANALFSEPDGY